MVQCDASHECPDGNTCCKLSTGQWGCCPLPQAVCCSDGVHCCPSGTTCDTASGKCNRQDGSSVSWFQKTSAMRKNIEMVHCDSTHECPDGNTCCKLTTGQWGCCPLPKAVCCSDGVHCCPSGTTCDTASGKCKRQDGSSVSWFQKTSAIKKKTENVKCDETRECPDGNTCCKLSSGQWGCCPMPEAVCCSDGAHCCPKGTTCNTAEKTCDTQDGDSMPWVKKLSVIENNNLGVFTCNGSSKKCNDGQTCCAVADGHVGCCVFTNGVCCSDGTHCCPSGSTCDVESGHCVNKGQTIPWSQHVQEDTQSDLPCGESTCPSTSTCCKLSSGQFGCCPLPKAVCCSDGVHCCPSGTTCDVSQGKCNRQDGFSMTWFKKTPLSPKKDLTTVQCDSTHSCPGENTCCRLPSYKWGCCPLPKAVCCPDMTHCCPSGTTCDTASGKCNRQDGSSFSWFQKTSAIRKNKEMVQCDDTQSCPDGNTCCKLTTGQWGCCPLPQAVCCSDGVHCCPSGTTCDTASGKCNRQDGSSVSWFQKTSAMRKNKEMVQCDDTQSCPDGSTCCKLSTGQWGCCPLPQAVCCSDGVHCCPTGTTCDTASGKCNRQDGSSISWFQKIVAVSVSHSKDRVTDVTCQDGNTCPNGSTCCKLSGGSFGCCPIENAVCCTDGVHCCPQGYTCDVVSGNCNNGFMRIPFS